jgi:polyisoprenoid-binding protein YceI
MEATLEGRAVDMGGVERIGLSAQGSLNRQDFGISWSGWMGRYLVGDEVRIELDVEAVRQTV